MSRGAMLRAALASFLGTGLSRVLGLVRDVVIASQLGAGVASDALYMALSVPGAARRFVADEGLTGALVPAVARAEHDVGEDEATRLAARLLTSLLVVGAGLSFAGVLGAPVLVSLFAPGFEGESRELTVKMTRILFPMVVFVSLVSWAEGLLNHRDHFFIPKVAPGVISATVVVAAFLPFAETAVDVGLAISWGFLVGSALHLAICMPPLWKRYGLVLPRLDVLSDPRSLGVFREMGKVAVIGLMAQINILVLRQVLSFFAEGSVTNYTYATRMVDFAQGIIAVGVGSAMLPVISKAAAADDWPGFREAFGTATRLVAALLVPTAAFLLVLSTPAVAVLFRRGAYSWEDCQIAGLSLMLLVPYMLALAGIQIVKKPFFALERRNVLIGVGGLGVLLTGALGVALGVPFGVPGVAVALSVSTTCQFAAYLLLLSKMVQGKLGLRALVSPVLRMALASVPAALVGWGVGQLGDWSLGGTWTNLGLLGAAGLVGGALYFAVASALGVAEVRAIVRRVVGRFAR